MDKQVVTCRATEGSRLEVMCLTNKGMERPRNEDSCYAASRSYHAFMVVADGMGGHRAGNIASEIAAKEAERAWQRADLEGLLPGEGSRTFITGFIDKANRRILDQAEKSLTEKGMGTTVTAALLCGARLTIGHVGDSRAYNISDGKISQLTKDHSFLEQMIETGRITAEEARTHPKRHILTRALGISPDLKIDVDELEVEFGSTLLLCTDGLTNMLRDEEILAVVQTKPDPQHIAETLVKMANERGGHDNITVIVATGIGGQQA